MNVQILQKRKNYLSQLGDSYFQGKTVYPILGAICIGHLYNDLILALVPAMYPILQKNYSLSFAQIGFITFSFQIASSIFQPLVGHYTDKKPIPYSQMIGMLFSMAGIICMAYATHYYWILLSVVLIGIGSSIFHPESSRISYMASGGKRSMAQSIFQIGGNSGAALGPLLIATIVLPNHQSYLLWFLLIGFGAQITYNFIGTWYAGILRSKTYETQKKTLQIPQISQKKIVIAIVTLLILIFSKYFYIASITSYFQFYTMDKFGISAVQAQFYLFLFLSAIALGTLIGGILGDKVGRKFIIWFSILAAAPFTLALPYASLQMTGVLIFIIGFVFASAFPSIIVFAQELMPRKIGVVTGLFYGFAFGMGGVGSALLGIWADQTSINLIYKVCSFLPLLGVVAIFLPNMKKVTYKTELKEL